MRGLIWSLILSLIEWWICARRFPQRQGWKTELQSPRAGVAHRDVHCGKKMGYSGRKISRRSDEMKFIRQILVGGLSTAQVALASYRYIQALRGSLSPVIHPGHAA
jgi:hypothetical protein